MRILIKGAGDLATGIAVVLHREGHQIVMTELPVPLTVRRTVAFSRAVYEKTAVVEGIRAVCVENLQEAERVLEAGQVAVVVDEKAEIRKEYCPDVLVDGVMAKKNTGTSITDASLVIAIGPGFLAGSDCHFVIETVRGNEMGKLIFSGGALPNTGVPGNVGGYTKERLLKAADSGRMRPMASIGDFVKKGKIVAMTGEKPVAAEISGIVRGMLQAGVSVKYGMKIGDIHPGTDISCCEHISDKAEKIGRGVREAIRLRECSDYAVVVLAAGFGNRFGKNKLMEKVSGQAMYLHIIEQLKYFPKMPKYIVTQYPAIMKEAQKWEINPVENPVPQQGISSSIRMGLKRCLKEHPEVRGILFCVADQPGISSGTLCRMIGMAQKSPEKIICAGHGRGRGNPVLWPHTYFQELLELSGDIGGRQIIKKYPSEILVCETRPEELKDIDRKSDF